MSERSEAMRALFAERVTAERVTVSELYCLWTFIDEALRSPGEHMPMRLQPLNDKVMDAIFRHGWPARGCEFKVNGAYFTGREGISFQRSGFIGFAGWSSTDNETPFVQAFEVWVKSMPATTTKGENL